MNDTAHHEIWPTIIIGAGASGLFCAGSFPTAKLVLEHNERPGKKLNITGGGKCNFSHLPLSSKDYLSTHKHFAHATLAAFPPEHFLHLLQKADIPVKQQENGCLFAGRAQDITRYLFQRAKQAHTTFSFNTQVLQVNRRQNLFEVQTSKGIFQAYRVVVASGGMSYPQLGASGLAWQIAQHFQVPVIPPRPVLAGLRVEKNLRNLCKQLAGNAVPVQISLAKRTEEGNLLFTHEGFSGPAVLQISLYWQEGEKILLNFCPSVDVLAYLKAHKQNASSISKVLSPFIPVKITKTLLGPLDTKLADASRQQLIEAAQRLNRFTFVPLGTAGYTHAEATAGGIDTAALDTKTLVCKAVPGLFFIGEAVDVTGRVGGFNLHWAWASAYMAAKALQNAAP